MSGSSIRATALATLCLLLAGCPTPPLGDRTPRTGAATMAFALSVSDITRVVVTISGTDFAPPVTAELSIHDGRATGTIAQIPAGPDRRFLVEAYRGAEVVCTGETTADVVAGAAIRVEVTLQCVPDAEDLGEAVVEGTFNFPPRIDRAAADASHVAPGATLRLSAEASDPNPGDALSFRWTATAGSFSDATAASTAWTAPVTEGLQTVTLTVSDSHGASTSLDLEVHVGSRDGGVAPADATAGDAGADGGAAGPDAAADAGVAACLCTNPSDDCVDTGYRTSCVRSNYTCNVLSPCDPGYDCVQSRCVCQDQPNCGIDCTSARSCPVGLTCDPNTDVCWLPQQCLVDAMCSAGEVCNGDESGVCRQQTGAATGAACQSHNDCSNGRCYTQVCLQPCQTNSDCPVGQLCEGGSGGPLAPGCMLQSNCTNCGGPSQYCYRSRCYDTSCRRGSDCPSDECIMLGFFPIRGHCGTPVPSRVDAGVNSTCGDDEFVADVREHAFCITYDSCWTDADCQAPYRCLTARELEDFEPALLEQEAGFCGRSR